MGLFGTDKPNVTFLKRKDEFFKNYFFNKKLCDGIKLVADIERSSKKNAAELLMKAVLSSYMGGKLTKYIEDERAAREQNQKIKMTHFIMVLRKYARQHGMDISKII